MLKKILWAFASLSAVLIGIYPLIYLFADKRFGLLEFKDEVILSSVSYNTAFYLHIFLGGLALLIGWSQFIPKIRNYLPNLHRLIGKIYVAAVLLSSISAIYIGFWTTGGTVNALGFILLGIVWFSTTVSAFLYIKKGRIKQHEKMMIYSYAACFAAVTLRIYNPLLIAYFGDFDSAYRIIAWLSWIPNLLVAYLIIKIKERNLAVTKIKPQTFNQNI